MVFGAGPENAARVPMYVPFLKFGCKVLDEGMDGGSNPWADVFFFVDLVTLEAHATCWYFSHKVWPVEWMEHLFQETTMPTPSMCGLS